MRSAVAFLLAFVMCVGMLPSAAYAAGTGDGYVPDPDELIRLLEENGGTLDGDPDGATDPSDGDGSDVDPDLDPDPEPEPGDEDPGPVPSVKTGRTWEGAWAFGKEILHNDENYWVRAFEDHMTIGYPTIYADDEGFHVGGETLDFSMFQDLTPMVEHAWLTLPVGEGSDEKYVRYDLKANPSLPSINPYKTFDVEASFNIEHKVTDDYGVEHVQKLFTWKINGISSQKLFYSQLIANGKDVVGYYIVNTDGRVYLVLDDSVEKMLSVKCRISFGAKWGFDSADLDVGLDLGDGKDIPLNVNTKKGEITKELVSAKDGRFRYKSVLTAYTDLEIESISDVFSPSNSTTSAFLEEFTAPPAVEEPVPDGSSTDESGDSDDVDGGESGNEVDVPVDGGDIVDGGEDDGSGSDAAAMGRLLHDHMVMQNVTYEVSDGRAGSVGYISAEDDNLSCVYGINFERTISVKKGDKFTLYYDFEMSEDMRAAFYSGNRTLSFENTINANVVGDDNVLSATASGATMNKAEVVSKTVNDELTDVEYEWQKVFELTFRDTGVVPAHGLVTDTLSDKFPDLQYAPDSDQKLFFSADGAISYMPEFIEVEPDVFKDLTWASVSEDPELLREDGFSNVYYCGNSFKFFLPDGDTWRAHAPFTLRYVTTWNDEIKQAFEDEGNQVAFLNDVSLTHSEYTYRPPGYIPIIDPPEINKDHDRDSLGFDNVDEYGRPNITWHIDTDVKSNMSYTTGFYIRDRLPAKKIYSDGGYMTFKDDLQMADHIKELIAEKGFRLVPGTTSVAQSSYDMQGKWLHFEDPDELFAETGIRLWIENDAGDDITDDLLRYGSDVNTSGINFYYDDSYYNSTEWRYEHYNYYGYPTNDSPYAPTHVQFYVAMFSDVQPDGFSDMRGCMVSPGYAYHIRMDVPAVLDGMVNDKFGSHTNMVRPWVGFTNNSFAQDTVKLVDTPFDGSKLHLYKSLVEKADDSATGDMILTYDVKLDMSDCTIAPPTVLTDSMSASGSSSTISSSSFTGAKDTLGVYLVDDINDPDDPGLAVNLLELDSENPFVSIDETDASNLFRLNLDWSACDRTDSGRWKSVVVRYSVRINNSSGKFTGAEISNYARLYESPDHMSYPVFRVVASDTLFARNISKSFSTVSSEPGVTTGRYKIDILSEKYVKEGQKSLEIVDESSGPMQVKPSTVKVYGGETLSTSSLVELDPSQYTLVFNEKTNRLVCSIDLTELHKYYRLEYDVLISGTPGSSVNVSNKAYVGGAPDDMVVSNRSPSIQNATGNASYTSATITISKYNADNIKQVLPGADFELYRMNTLAARALTAAMLLSPAEDQSDVFEALDGIAVISPFPIWEKTASGTTNENGEIVWSQMNGDIDIQANQLLKLVETKAPTGYVLPEGDDAIRYFYVSDSDSAVPAWLKKFDAKNVDCAIFVPNQKGNFEVLKTDSTTGEPLSGASFAIYSSKDCDDGDIVFRGLELDQVNAPGVHYFGDLDVDGTAYYLKETAAPEGYTISEHVWEISFDESGLRVDGKTVDGFRLTVANTPEGDDTDYFMLPGTGGMGTMPFLAAGLVILASCAMYWFARKRRRDDGI